MGLAVVVILITLGMLFVVMFMFSSKDKETRKAFTETEIASNMLSALLRTTTKDCFETSVKELMQDCTLYIDSPGSQLSCANGLSSCDYLKNTLFFFFNKTLIEWGNRSFMFKIERISSIDPSGSSELIFNASNIKYVNNQDICEISKERKQNPLQTEKYIMLVTLDICG